jgi:NAD(P)H dehydrogenase (quinone)
MSFIDQETPKVQVCVIFHSPYGHTAKVAQHIAQGAEQEGQKCISFLLLLHSGI